MQTQENFAYECVVAKGHRNIRALHPTTFELTKDEEVTERGDCIIGVGLDKAVADLDPHFKNVIRNDLSIVDRKSVV